MALSLLSDTQYALQFSQARTLFHEFGHVLNVLFSRTRYQHLAGVRSPLDYVEAPSTLMEHFLQDFSFLSRFASHCNSRRPLSEGVFGEYMKESVSQALFHTKSEVILSKFDLVSSI